MEQADPGNGDAGGAMLNKEGRLTPRGGEAMLPPAK
jgi:hypothetical protein